MYKIVAHPGSAHKDDFMAVSVLLATLGAAEIYRGEPTHADLADPNTYVVDVGLDYDPQKHNFDHHQDKKLPCAFHLVMQHLGLHDAAKALFVWYTHMSMMDVRGPYKTAEHLGIDTSVLFAASSPIEGYIMSRFSAVERLNPGEMLYDLMKEIGESMIQLIDMKQERLERLKAESQVVPLKHLKALVCKISDNPKLAMEIYLRELNDEKIVICITPSIRGEGWEMFRLGDSKVVDFRRLSGREKVRFIHISGFVAKTTSLLPMPEVLALAAQAIVSE